MEIQSIYQAAIRFAASKHAEKNQTIPDTNLPYVVHLSNVAMEIMTAYQHGAGFRLGAAVQLALLHDTIEDTATSFDEIAAQFGSDTAAGVQALTKNSSLPQAEKMMDSLVRIKAAPKEVWAVKLADRITNLQEPPQHWSKEKKQSYRQEAILILEYLKGADPYLEERLAMKIAGYEKYIQQEA